MSATATRFERGGGDGLVVLIGKDQRAGECLVCGPLLSENEEILRLTVDVEMRRAEDRAVAGSVREGGEANVAAAHSPSLRDFHLEGGVAADGLDFGDLDLDADVVRDEPGPEGLAACGDNSCGDKETDADQNENKELLHESSLKKKVPTKGRV